MTDFKESGIPAPDYDTDDINYVYKKSEFTDDVFIYGKLYADLGGDVQSFSTGGVERMRITKEGDIIFSSNNVNISGVTKIATLDVSGNTNLSGITTGTFVGDGSGLIGVTASGTGIVVKNSGSTVGTAGTINFENNLDVVSFSGGAVTVRGSQNFTGIVTATNINTTNINTTGVGDVFIGGEFNMTNNGNKNRFIDSSLSDGEGLHIRSTQGGDINHENMAVFARNEGVRLFYDAVEKFITQSHGINVHGDIHLGAISGTTTNQNRRIFWTGFDKEGDTDFTDTAEIRHTTNVHGIPGSVLEIKTENDANDGIALHASSGNGQIALVGKKIDVFGYIEPSFGTGDNGIKWASDPSGGTGDIAHIQYFQDGSGENTRLRIEIANDADDEIELKAQGGVSVTGNFSKSSGSFRIPHVLAGLTTTTDLIHSFVESPQADNLYRGRTKLVAGISTVNIDTTNNMTDGTFVNLNRDVQCFTSNETGWTAVKGSVTGNLLTIVAQDNACTDTISWMVVGERWDLAMYDPRNPMTDANGKVRTEIPNRNYVKGYNEDYISENKFRVGISTISRPTIENKEIE